MVPQSERPLILQPVEITADARVTTQIYQTGPHGHLEWCDQHYSYTVTVLIPNHEDWGVVLLHKLPLIVIDLKLPQIQVLVETSGPDIYNSSQREVVDGIYETLYEFALENNLINAVEERRRELLQQISELQEELDGLK